MKCACKKNNPIGASHLPLALRNQYHARINEWMQEGATRAEATKETDVEFAAKLEKYIVALKKKPALYKANPPAAPSSLVGIGKFAALEYDDANGQRAQIAPAPGELLWLAWRGTPERGDMLVVDVAGREKARGDDETAIIHKNFHGEAPVSWARVVWTPPTQAVERLGFVRSITYRVPARMPSNKNDADYIHAFGDFGGGVDMREESQYWPALGHGADGSLYIIRRRFNKYKLADWLEG
mgnify:CR=1 FL=1